MDPNGGNWNPATPTKPIPTRPQLNRVPIGQGSRLGEANLFDFGLLNGGFTEEGTSEMSNVNQHQHQHQRQRHEELSFEGLMGIGGSSHITGSNPQEIDNGTAATTGWKNIPFQEMLGRADSGLPSADQSHFADALSVGFTHRFPFLLDGNRQQQQNLLHQQLVANNQQQPNHHQLLQRLIASNEQHRNLQHRLLQQHQQRPNQKLVADNEHQLNLQHQQHLLLQQQQRPNQQLDANNEQQWNLQHLLLQQHQQRPNQQLVADNENQLNLQHLQHPNQQLIADNEHQLNLQHLLLQQHQQRSNQQQVAISQQQCQQYLNQQQMLPQQGVADSQQQLLRRQRVANNQPHLNQQHLVANSQQHLNAAGMMFQNQNYNFNGPPENPQSNPQNESLAFQMQSRQLYDLNSPPVTMVEAVTDGRISFQHGPLTPDRGMNQQVLRDERNGWQDEGSIVGEMQSLMNKSDTVLESESQPAGNSSDPLYVEENHNLEKGQGFDLNEAPEQKAKRKKIRPRVVKEGKQRTRKVEVKQGDKKENPPKRKYVRKNTVDGQKPRATDAGQVGGNSVLADRTTDASGMGKSDVHADKTAEATCKRKLQFDPNCIEEGTGKRQATVNHLEGEQSNNHDSMSARLNTSGNNSTVQQARGLEVVEKSPARMEFDLNHTLTQLLGDVGTAGDTAQKGEVTRLIFPAESVRTDDSAVSSMSHQSTHLVSKDRNSSNCRPNLSFAEGEHLRASERGDYHNLEEAHVRSFNKVGTHFPSLQIYGRMLQRNGQHMQNSPAEMISCKEVSRRANHDKVHLSGSMLTFAQTERMRKGPKGPTRVRDFASLTAGSECSNLPSIQPRTPISGEKQGAQIHHRTQSCLQAPSYDTSARLLHSNSKTCNKRNEVRMQETQVVIYSHQQSAKSKGSPKMGRRVSSPVDELVRKFAHLRIDDVKRTVLGNEQTALVPYTRDSQMVPYGGLFNPIKKRKPRAKVDLDPETDRVWKLLMGKESVDGVEGSDEEREKRWEKEREIFRGRTDSFIARMHLIQGDRRFSKWTGSVVDSVVGVFLTQNVSDHLSSSAFMSLAAHFPLKSTSNERTYNGGGYMYVQEPVVQEPVIQEPEVVDLDEIQWHAKTTGEPINNKTPVENREVGNSNESLGSNAGGTSFTNITKCTELFTCDSTLDSSKNRVEMGSPGTECTNLVEDKKLLEAQSSGVSSGVSSQNSVDDSIHISSVRTTNIGSARLLEGDEREALDDLVSSQNSANSSIAHTDENIRSCSDSNSEEEELTTGCKPNRFSATTFTELLQMANTTMLQEYFTQGSGSLSSDLHSRIGIRSEQSELRGELEGETDNRAANSEQSELRGETDKRATNLDRISGQKDTFSIYSSTSELGSMQPTTPSRGNTDTNTEKAKRKAEKEKKKEFDWDSLRKEALHRCGRREKSQATMDSLDWEAVRCADVNEIAQTIKERGMNNMLAERIKDFLNRLVREHGSVDLEWLRDVPPDQAKEYLLSVRGLGLKSVECVRLLTLHHLAFPVDTNVGRIAVRLGWVPLQPLPESIQLHLLELYPIQESIQKYLWPRLCKLDQETLYELHYQLITFGKVFCTKSKPNCNACPMRAECKHFASAFASARLSLPAPEEKGMVQSTTPITANQSPPVRNNPMALPPPQTNVLFETTPAPQTDMLPISQGQIEAHGTRSNADYNEPIIEVPASPEPEDIQEIDIEDAFSEDPDEIPTIELNLKEFTTNLQNYMQANSMGLQEVDASKALVALNPAQASIPTPKLKNVSRLRTEHQVYELPDSHPLLDGVPKRVTGEICPYLLAIWTPGETAESIQPPERCCESQMSGNLCNANTCFSCNSVREANAQTVRGTLLIPCRTAMRGSFPLNGTYFQVNEVFADHDSSLAPIDVPRSWLWSLSRRTVLFGTSIPSIFKGQTTSEIQNCFWKGFVCVRGFDQKTRAPRPLMARLHFPASRLIKPKPSEGAATAKTAEEGSSSKGKASTSN